jgi:hypothetical protein
MNCPINLNTSEKSAPINVLIQVYCPPNGKLLLTIQAGNPARVIPKTYARFVPERFDDFAWENDRIAHRIYGPGLANRPDNAFGIDVWSKRTHAMILDKWYKLMDFDTDHGEGLDFYGVGKTLGAGDIAIDTQDTLHFTNNFSRWKILDNGPLSSTFELSYTTRIAGGIHYTVRKLISIDAGSQLSRIEVVFNEKDIQKIPVAIGIVKRTKPGSILLDEKTGTMAYWEPENPVHGTTGLGCVLISPVQTMVIERGHLLAKAVAKAGQPFIYYTGAAWSRAPLIHTDQDWFAYVHRFAEQKRVPLIVNIL